ncbi:Ribonuclease [Saliniradius amylolyticus]|uniref:Ribonuclease n=1 Tax=Saliniradius amylolyticus TaxID=2183582 RepID=A0A2S2E4I0_9ALTE|nr:MBL fold metallo-hydrolase [Saliniradius amylolyticus]AWL11907.1 Ribonuclease [Saliniradius amylolyticus]
MPEVTFFGAAQEVTGSCHRISHPGLGHILLDCGMHQGGDAVSRLQEEHFEFSPRDIDAVVLSHAHLDHSGMLPKMIHQGFTGPIYCTKATAELLSVLLNDAAGLYLRDLEKENLRRRRQGKRRLSPVYSMKDVEQVLKQCVGLDYETEASLSDNTRLVFHDAGHILGSAITELSFLEPGEQKPKTLVFSGDLGNTDMVLMRDPSFLRHADVLMMESTYGDREHKTQGDTLSELEQILADTWQRGGNVMIPAFAVGRTQEILFHLGCLHQQGRLDNWQIFLDSPMAIEVTQIYDHWVDWLDTKDTQFLDMSHPHPLEEFLPHLFLAVTPEDSMAINSVKKGCIVIAGSGMCTGGRIRHHFKQRIWNPHNTLLFVGFQARGTLGRILVDGAKFIRLFGEQYAVKARIETLGGFSAHAGQSGLVNWASAFTPTPKLILVHGEPGAQKALAQRLERETGQRPLIPAQKECFHF